MKRRERQLLTITAIIGTILLLPVVLSDGVTLRIVAEGGSVLSCGSQITQRLADMRGSLGTHWWYQAVTLKQSFYLSLAFFGGGTLSMSVTLDSGKSLISAWVSTSINSRRIRTDYVSPLAPTRLSYGISANAPYAPQPFRVNTLEVKVQLVPYIFGYSMPSFSVSITNIQLQYAVSCPTL